ncbi:MAG: NAD(P)H-dependent oxidoreductase [Rhodobacteraceae bacterium]|nr:NAD(P)H-dependent oxidoreductase [Paracoccaceae bacterium]
MQNPKILVLSGSSRSGSLNTQLAALTCKRLALADADVSRISLADYSLPIYNGDLEEEKGVPENAKKLATLFEKQQGVFIASPEYNAGVPPLLKNAVDWMSRVSKADGKTTTAFKEPVFALGSASPGGFGGVRNMIGFRTVMEFGLGANVLPEMIILSRAGSAFTDKGDLKDEGVSKQLDTVVAALLDAARRRM